MIGGNDHYMARWNDAFAMAKSEGDYASHLRDAAQAEWQHVMNMGDHFEGGYDEATMSAQQNKKLTFSQADDHDMHKVATNDSGHIAVDAVNYCRGLFG